MRGFARPCSWAYALAFLACGSTSACVREHTLFEGQPLAAGASGEAEDGGDATAPGGASATAGGSGGAGAPNASVPGPPWAKASCVAALSAGKTGDACTGAFSCSATFDCCVVNVGCKGELLYVQSACDQCTNPCTVDADCSAGDLCEAYQCVPCPSDPCPDTWNKVERNGCAVCVPKNQCTSDGECGADQKCLSGASCLPGCKSDPGCCFGNRCVATICEPPKDSDCLIVGCPAGSTCKAASQAVDCSCEPKLGTWSCSDSIVNKCVKR